MKVAFAKMLEKNPVESSLIAFRAGGNGVPILTRASGQSTTGYQTMGLPDGSMPKPGGGANKTTLGAYRMGDQDGNAAASAIYSGEIFNPPGQPDRTYPERTFAVVGNNVFQPENNDLATHALLKRLGDQQFKASSAKPFEDYMAQQRLVRDLDEASRNASLSDLGISRDIIRGIAAERRQQNEDDYLRKMLDAGATPEAARKEIEDVRNANAIREAKKVDDREYQAKMLIQKIALSRGVTPMVREPMNQSSSIDNPQRSQATSQAMGQPGQGFGTSPLDANRKTPDFYKKFLRRSNMSQESQDEATAFGQLLTQGEIPVPSSGSFSLATLKGQERQLQIENAQDTLAARLDTIRARGKRIMKPLPPNIIAKEFLDNLYSEKQRSKGNKALYSFETIEDLKPTQLLIAMNLATITNPKGLTALKEAIVNNGPFGSPTEPAKDLTSRLRAIVLEVNGGESNISIPYASAVLAFKDKYVVQLLEDIKTSQTEVLSKQVKAAREEYLREVSADDIPFAPGEPMIVPPPKSTGKGIVISRVPGIGKVKKGDSISVRADKALAQGSAAKIQALVRGRQVRVKEAAIKKGVGEAMTGLLDTVEFNAIDNLDVKGLKRELAAAGLSTKGNKPELVARLKDMYE